MSTLPEASVPWWTSAVVYQIYPRSFADSNGDGIGDLGGIRSKLDHLAELGVDVVWLSPVYPSPQHDNGYDISDYQDIDPLFGSLEEFDLLLAEAHERSIKIVMDLVVNHTSDEHAWFVESASGPDSPKRDWYWWRPARPGDPRGSEAEAAIDAGIEPNGWRSYFSGPAWTRDGSGEYFLHLFAVQQPDLNWENPEVRQAVYAMMNWWLDRGVDGFRMDVINLISKRLEQIDGGADADGIVGGVGPRLHEFLHEMHLAVFAGRDGKYITVGEMPGVTLADAELVTDPARQELDMVFQFEHVGIDHGTDKFHPIPLDLVALKANLARWQDGLAERGWNSLYLNNHDQPRLVSRFGDDGAWRYEAATLWATLMHLQRGTPYIYQGEEIGMTNVPFDSIDDFRDIESINYYAEAIERGEDAAVVLDGLRAQSRDNARTPVQWDGSAHAGFTTGEPWIPVNPNYSTVNVVADRASDRSVFDYYRRLIALRHEDETVQLGRFELLEPEHPTLFAFTRTGADAELLVVGNVSGSPLDVELLELWEDAEVLIGNTAEPARSTLGPWEARVLRRRSGY
ncbi:alpha-glucosidase [Microbacteriaceae bacterium VKM Ac-2854]|nr:alpha-glucosidase [Microbacteriaceae bacterium VKM Ac-2854]